MARASTPRRAGALGSVLGLALGLLSPGTANAQLHWDGAAQVGVMKRVLSNRPSGGEDAGFGPVGQLTGHLALLPLVRVGAYFGHDISPLGGDASARDITWGGLRAKIMSPFPRGDLRAWIFVGFGYAGVYQRSTSAVRNFPGPPGNILIRSDAVVEGAGGGYFEVPYGIGASYNIRKPWALCAELGMRSGFGHSGSVYEAPGPQVTSAGRASSNALPAGKDTFGIGLTVGVLVDL